MLTELLLPLAYILNFHFLQMNKTECLWINYSVAPICIH